MTTQIPPTSSLMTRLLGLGRAAEAGAADHGSAAHPLYSGETTDSTHIAISSLTRQAQAIERLLSGLERNISAMQLARDHITEVVGNIEEAGGITVRARDTLKTAAGYEGNKERLAELEKRFSAALEKNDALIAKLKGPESVLLKGGSLTTAFDEVGRSVIETHGHDLTTAGLEFRKPDFSTLFKVQDSRIDVMNAIDIAVTVRHQIVSDLLLIETRQEFSRNAIASLNEGARTVELTDLGDEAANLLALQVRQQLGESGESLASEAQRQQLSQL